MSGTTTDGGLLWGFRGRAQGPAPTITVGDKLCGNDRRDGDEGPALLWRAGTGTRPYDSRLRQVQFRLIFSALEMVMGASVMKRTTMADRNQI